MKINKNSLKAIQTRNRVNFHRRWKSILNYENQSKNKNSVDGERVDVNFNDQEQAKMGANEQLIRWALKYNVAKHAVSELLKILISLGMNWLPKDSRTLLSTPRYVELKNLTNGKIWYDVFSNSNY